jgi:hypothetical protein
VREKRRKSVGEERRKYGEVREKRKQGEKKESWRKRFRGEGRIGESVERRLHSPVPYRPVACEEPVSGQALTLKMQPECRQCK